jgi:hypothetical protein
MSRIVLVLLMHHRHKPIDSILDESILHKTTTLFSAHLLVTTDVSETFYFLILLYRLLSYNLIIYNLTYS